MKEPFNPVLEGSEPIAEKTYSLPGLKQRPNTPLYLRPLAVHFDLLPSDATLPTKFFSAVHDDVRSDANMNSFTCGGKTVPLIRVGHFSCALAAHFDQLPNEATVPIKVFAIVAAEGVSTLWGKAKRRTDFPQPIRRGPKCTRFNVGEIRAYLLGRGAE